jgi:hypothetical protein
MQLDVPLASAELRADLADANPIYAAQSAQLQMGWEK